MGDIRRQLIVLLVVSGCLSFSTYASQLPSGLIDPAAEPGNASLSQVQKRQQRVIALAPHLVELLFEIDAGEQIIGTSSFADYPAAAKLIPNVGDHSRLLIEKILQLQPDLILAWRSGTPADDLERLAEFGLQIAYSHPVELADIATELRWLGALTGRQTLADAKATAFSQRLSQLRQRYQQRQPISVFYEIWSSPLQTIARNAWPQKQLTVCGAHNIIQSAHSDYPSVSLEQVLTYNPQVIIQPRTKGQPHSGFDWAQYPMLQAVKHDLLIYPDADKAYRMTLRVLDEVQWMCEQLQQARSRYP